MPKLHSTHTLEIYLQYHREPAEGAASEGADQTEVDSPPELSLVHI